MPVRARPLTATALLVASFVASFTVVVPSSRAAGLRTLTAMSDSGDAYEVTAPDDLVRCAGPDRSRVYDPEDLPARTGEPVLLVHGTFTNGRENYRWAQARHLEAAGFTACWMSYPNRGLDDQQTSAEWVAAAILELAEATGAPKVDVLGHSQGAVLPRWAIRWFPAVADTVDDLVQFAGPNNGTALTQLYGLFGSYAGCRPGVCTASYWQFSPDSQFVTAMNRGWRLRADVDYTNLYSDIDELVRHGIATGDLRAEARAAAELPAADNAVTVSIQELCPGRPVEHAGFFVDRPSAMLAIDAFRTDGPGDPAAVDPLVDCATSTIDADWLLAAQLGSESFPSAFTETDYDASATGEPALRDYARPAPAA